ncbi:MAG: DUF3048 domain-containing protein [Clostridia bacterium]|nr:DUF3048 domain-containing protein [Clostridia bacterium]
MKRFLCFALCFIIICSFSGCGKKDVEITPPPVETPEVVEPEISEFYTKMQTDFRPIAVMIDNDEASSRPQLGLESAYLVYEIVVEGGATRFLALFNDASLEKVGPVRSSRHYFLDYALENDARYVHAGWSDRAAAEIRSRGINNINGIYETIFWRDNTYNSGWHNLYTGLDKVAELSDKKGYRNTTDKKLLTYHKLDEEFEGTPANTLTLPYANFYKVEFRYNEDKKAYDRYVNGSGHMSQTGDILSAKNIIVYKLSDVPLNDGINATRRDLINVGSGTGYYLSNGVATNIRWEKTGRSNQTKYTLEDGSPLVLNPGNTYIEIFPTWLEFSIN